MQIAHLLSRINEVIQQGLGELTLTSDLVLAPAGTLTTGRIRFSGSAIQYSVDGGVSWQNITDVNYAWVQGATYVRDDVVLYEGAWYVCAVNVTTDAPGGSVAWRLLTLGASIVYVHTVAELVAALQRTDNCTIYVAGELSGVVNATVVAPCITIYSDETTTLTCASITLSMGTGCNVYWHCSNTVFMPSSLSVAMTINATGGTLWLDRLIAGNNGLALSGNVNYRYIDGAVSGGQQEYWTQSDDAQDKVNATLSSYASAAYSDAAQIYATTGVPARMTLGTISENIAAKTAKYWHINAQGPVANLPGSAPEGYLYYASDTGDLYRYGSSGWDSGVHIQGPQGSPGISGSAGAPGISPEVTMTSVSGGTEIRIVDSAHPGGQSFTVSNGQNGQTPTLSMGVVVTLPASSAAYASFGGTAPNYVLNMGIPKGSDGVTSWGQISGLIDEQADLSSALGGKQDTITSDSPLPFSLVSGAPSVGSGTMTLYQGAASIGHFGANEAADVNISIAEIGSGILSVTSGGSVVSTFDANATSNVIVELPATSAEIYTIASPGATLDYANGDYQKMTLSANLTITNVSNMSAGQGMLLEVTTAGGATLTINSQEIITSGDTGVFVLGFIHNGTGVKVFKSAAELIGLA